MKEAVIINKMHILSEVTSVNRKTLKMIYSALFTALIFVATQFIRLPLPFGYFNFGDCFVILSAVVIGGPHSAAAAAIGSVLADILSGYTIYAPATLIIKGIMAVVMILSAKPHSKRSFKNIFLILGSVVAEVIMILGYFLYDVFLYGIGGAVASVFGNIMQGIISVLASMFILKLLEHSGLLRFMKLQ